MEPKLCSLLFRFTSFDKLVSCWSNTFILTCEFAKASNRNLTLHNTPLQLKKGNYVVKCEKQLLKSIILILLGHIILPFTNTISSGTETVQHNHRTDPQNAHIQQIMYFVPTVIVNSPNPSPTHSGRGTKQKPFNRKATSYPSSTWSFSNSIYLEQMAWETQFYRLLLSCPLRYVSNCPVAAKIRPRNRAEGLLGLDLNSG